MPTTSNRPSPLILASSSPYRRELLQRFGLPFETVSPDIDESRLANESAQDLSIRLATEKALAVARNHANACVIGSDQVLACGGELLGKPGSHDKAVAQLQKLSGQSMTFYTALAVVHAASEQLHIDMVKTEVRFRELSLEEIERYLDIEPAYDCAGSCKAEGLGISLCEAIESEDPTAIIGLPLIGLRRLLVEAGYSVP